MKKFKMKKIISILFVVCMMVIMVTGCSNNDEGAVVDSETPGVETEETANEEETTEAETNDEGASSETIVFTDSAGREVEVPKDITRIVPSGSLAQIVLFAIAPEMFVGITNEWSSEAEQYLDTEYYNLPVLGQFYGQDILNLEEIARLDPQVIIDVGESKDTIVEDMEGISDQVGIPTVHIEATTESMGDAYRMLGNLLGKEEEAEVLASYCEDVYSNTQNIMDEVGEEGRANLIYSVGEDGLSVLAKDSFHAEIIDLVSNNVAVVDDISSKGSGNPVDMEQLILWDPDIILFAPRGAYDIVGDDETWQQLTAIQEGNYYEVPSGPYNWMGSPPSVNRYMGMIWSTQLLYPEVAQYDLYEEAVEYYELFYHSELTREQFDALVANAL